VGVGVGVGVCVPGLVCDSSVVLTLLLRCEKLEFFLVVCREIGQASAFVLVCVFCVYLRLHRVPK
jgi:hypothetical protein